MTVNSYINITYDKRLNSYVPTSNSVSSSASSNSSQDTTKKEETISTLKEKLYEVNNSKKELINKTLSSGKTLSSIQNDLKTYNNQLSEINKNISQKFQEQYSTIKSHLALYEDNEYSLFSAIKPTSQSLKIISAMQEKNQMRNVINNQIRFDSLERSFYEQNSENKTELEMALSKNKVLRNAIDSYKQLQIESNTNTLNYQAYNNPNPNPNQQQSAFIMNT